MNNQYKRELLAIMRGVKDEQQLNDFLVDILSPKEYEEIVKRWQIVKQLNNGVSQRQIAKNLKISLSKITRGSRMLLNKNGGFNQLLKKKK